MEMILPHLIGVLTALGVGLVLLWLGPIVIGWLTGHIFLTHYQRTLHKKDLEKRQRTLSNMFSNVWRILVVIISLYFVFVAMLLPPTV